MTQAYVRVLSDVSVFQLLDCFVIPMLMVLSWFFLKTRYRLVHFVAVFVCLLGVGAMVGADILAERDPRSSKDMYSYSLSSDILWRT